MRDRGAAGGGAGGRRRRGSALVVVIGSLALIAVFAAVYVTIGQSDRRTAEVAERERERDDVEVGVAEMIALTIAADRVGGWFEKIPVMDGAGAAAFSQRWVREAFDAAITDATVLSQFPASIDTNTPENAAVRERLRFRPEGTHVQPLVPSVGAAALGNNGLFGGVSGDGALVDLRISSDPFLAASEPGFAGFSVADRVYSRPMQGMEPRAELFWMDHRDWMQISNLAPDGRFVNLFNLRNNFDAPFTFEGDTTAEGNGISWGLSLLEPVNPADPATGLRATRTLPFGFNVAAAGSRGNPMLFPTLDSTLESLGLDESIFGLPVDPALIGQAATLRLEQFPIWTTMRQRFMYFPMDPSFEIMARDDGNPSTPAVPATAASPDFPDYQYADTDGDGMADARWFEPVNAYRPLAPVRLLSEAGGEFRWFVAARVVDLSGRVNLNLAADGLAAPTTSAPAGFTPAEVDLRRLLSMEDPAMSGMPHGAFAETPPGLEELALRLSLRHVEQPTPPGATASLLLDQADAAYQEMLADLRFDPVAHALADLTTDFPLALPGRFGYDAIRRELHRAPSPSDGLLSPPADEFAAPAWPSVRLAEQVGLTEAARAWVPTLDSSMSFDPFSFLSDRSPFLHVDAGIGSDPVQQRLVLQGVPLYQDPLPGMSPGPLMFHETPEGPGVARRLSWEILSRVDPFDAATLSLTGFESPPTSLSPMHPSFGAAFFGAEDLVELLAFEGFNSPVTSRLERVVGGRYQRNSAVIPDADNNSQRLSPLRSNRPLSLERDTFDNTVGYDLFTNGAPSDGFIGESGVNALSSFSTLADGADGVLDAEFLALRALDVRHRLTTISGAAALRSTVRTGPLHTPGARAALGGSVFSLARERVADMDGARTDLGGLLLADWSSEARVGLANSDPNRFADAGTTNNTNAARLEFDADPADNGIAFSLPDLFRLYSEALLPSADLALGAAWRTGDTNDLDEKMATLFYGHAGPELALRLAAHMAANFRDGLDLDDTPTVATLLVDGRVAGVDPLMSGSEIFRRDSLDAWRGFALLASTGLVDRRAFPFWSWDEPAIPAPAAGESQEIGVERRTRLDLDEIIGVVGPFIPGAGAGAGTRAIVPADHDLDGVMDTADDRQAAPRRLARDGFADDGVVPGAGPGLFADSMTPYPQVPGSGAVYAPNAAVPPERSVVNVIGVEAQPFLTEVGVINVFTDAPRRFIYGSLEAEILRPITGLGDSDFSGGSGEINGDASLLATPVAAAGPVTMVRTADTVQGWQVNLGISLDLTVNVTPIATGNASINDTLVGGPTGATEPLVNPDFVFQVFAFQVHNPFDHPVVLGSALRPSGIGVGSVDYLMEFGGWFFPLGLTVTEAAGGAISAAVPPSPITLAPGETVVFYAPSQPYQRIIDRIAAIGVGYSSGDLPTPTLAQIEELMVHQFGAALPPALGSTLRRPRAFRTVPVNPRTLEPDSNFTGGALGVDFLTPRDGTDAGDLNRLAYRFNLGGAPSVVAANFPSAVTIDEARLWRRHIAESGSATGAVLTRLEPEAYDGTITTELWIENDILVDRMRLNDPEDSFNYEPVVPPGISRVVRSADPGLSGHPFRRTAPGTALRLRTDAAPDGSFVRSAQTELLGSEVTTGTMTQFEIQLTNSAYDVPSIYANRPTNGAAPNPMIGADANNEDTGFTLALWASVRRPDHRTDRRGGFIDRAGMVSPSGGPDPDAGGDSPFPFFDGVAQSFPLGGLPAWCVESPDRGVFTNIIQDGTLNAADPGASPLRELFIWESGFADAGGRDNVQVFWNLAQALTRWRGLDPLNPTVPIAAPQNEPIIRTMTTPPDEKARRVYEWLGYTVTDGSFDALPLAGVRAGEVALGFDRRAGLAVAFDQALNPYTEFTPPDAWAPRNAANRYLFEEGSQLSVPNSVRLPLVNGAPAIATSATRPGDNEAFRRFGAVRDRTATGAEIEDPLSTLRVADLLSALAIGPVHAPLRDPAFADTTIGSVNERARLAALNVAPGEYVTLAEALGTALGFAHRAARITHPDILPAADPRPTQSFKLPTLFANVPGTTDPMSQEVHSVPDIAELGRPDPAAPSNPPLAIFPDVNADGTEDNFSVISFYAQTGAVLPTPDPSIVVRTPRAESSSRIDLNDIELASGINPPPGDPSRYDVYNELVVPSPVGDAAGTFFLLDGGFLRIDDFTAYFNEVPVRGSDDGGYDAEGELLSADVIGPANRDGAAPNRLYDPEEGDFRLGSGAPLAMAVFDIARGLGVGLRDNPPLVFGSDDRLTRLQPGRVNLNTAPLTVLRALPGLTPSLLRSFGDTAAEQGHLTADFWALREQAIQNARGGGSQPGTLGPVFSLFGVENPFIPEVFNRGSVPAAMDVSQFTHWRRNPDRAAMIAAYRDRSQAEFRTASQPRFLDTADARGSGVSLAELAAGDFSPIFAPFQAVGAEFPDRSNSRELIALMQRNHEAIPLVQGAAPTSLLNEDLADRGRSFLNGIMGLRPQPGLASFAELAGVAIAQTDPIANVVGNLPRVESLLTNGFSVADELDVQGDLTFGRRWENEVAADRDDADTSDAPELLGPHGLTWPGFDGRPLGGLLIDPARPASGSMTIELSQVVQPPPAGSPAGTPGSRTADGAADEFDEKLALLAQLHNTTDIRSDIFAAWFKVRGYSRADTQVGPAEIMTPSVERRFLMVVDRSNVTRLGQAPRILLFRELPIE